MMGKKKETRPQSMWEVLQEFRNFPVFIKKPQPPECKLSEMQLGPITDTDALKQVPQRRSADEDEDRG
jgi:hypothetical protein